MPTTPIFDKSTFATYFEANDAEALAWAENILNKLVAKGQVANYIERTDDDGNPTEFPRLFAPLVQFLSYFVRLAREFGDFKEDLFLADLYLTEQGHFTASTETLIQLQYLISNLLRIRRERGTTEMIAISTDPNVPSGELLRLFNWNPNTFFKLGLGRPQYNSWNLGNSSPLFRGLTGRYDLNVAWEDTEDFVDLGKYPLIDGLGASDSDGSDETYFAITPYLGKQALEITNVLPSEQAGIGSHNDSKGIVVDPRLSFEITFYVAQPPSASFILGAWTYSNTPNTNRWSSVAFGNDLFVAVSENGSGNRVMTSPDGQLWTSRTTPANYFWESVTFGNGLFVAVGNVSTLDGVMTSPDGITWTLRTAAIVSLIAITFGNNLFVAISSSGFPNEVMTSPDGLVWTARTIPADNQWVSLVFGNGLFVVVGQTGSGNRVMTSPDGITWTLRTSAADLLWTSICFGNNKFVAIADSGSGNRVMTSPDGITWTSRVSAADNAWSAVSFGDNLFVAVSPNGSNRVMTSPDGITWTLQSVPLSVWQGLTFGNNTFVAVNQDGTLQGVMTASFTGLLGHDLSFGCKAFDVDHNLISLVSAVDGSTQEFFFEQQRLNQAGRFYFVRGIIYSKFQGNLSSDQARLNIGYGTQLRFVDRVVRIVPHILVDNGESVGSATAYIWNVKITPCSTPYERCYLGEKNLIDIFSVNQSPNHTAEELDDLVRKYFIPYNAAFQDTHVELIGPTLEDSLLLETGDHLLLESGDRLLLEG